MVYQTNFHQTQPFSVALRRWWSRPMMTIPPSNGRSCTNKECAAMCAPCFGALLTVVAVYLIFLYIDKAHSHAKISLQSLALSSATWQCDFLVKIQTSRYSIYYNVDDAAVRLGSRNAAVLNITSQRVSRDDTAFSLVFVAKEENRSDAGALEVKLMAKHKRYVDNDEAGHFNIRCQNLTRIICESSFTGFRLFTLSKIRQRATVE
ncbi:Uncharacterized protein Rs2_11670 [Raphanus sativus]|uniref:Uncharacterized protein LOC108846730 n=1 Tax=Raphanus sativus TaxID=3726 RepID=A0A6J0MTD5_RAPSA|nr:uncharacterized protein LOC108846730 [Raphanus sativus]KAJ4908012.1 Uncharacterized protein Rs2_11670 [Raphanus sativus]